MFNFLRTFRLHQLSFWLGFLSATLFWWLFQQARPTFKKLRGMLRSRLERTRQKMTVSAEKRHRQNTLEWAQKQHVAAPLFSLDEILIQPRLIAPPPTISPGDPPPPEDIVKKSLPYMPDYPAFAAEYQAQTLTLEEALQKGANIALIGPPGIGKTVTLAHFAARLARKQTQDPAFNEKIPFYLHAGNLLAQLPADDLLATLTEALQAIPFSQTNNRLPELVETSFANQTAFLLIDGIDEFPPKDIQRLNQYFRQILEIYPETRLVVTASDQYYDGLVNLGLAPLAVNTWGRKERIEFAKQWGDMWYRFVQVADDEETEADFINPLLLNGWLFQEKGSPSPLSFTLKVWSVYAGDVKGPSLADAYEAYLARITARIPRNPRLALRNIAWQAALNQTVYFAERDAQKWTRSDDYQPLEEEEEGKASPFRVMLTPLIEHGLIRPGKDETMMFGHISLAGYLAGQVFHHAPEEEQQAFLDQPAWALKRETLLFAQTEGGVQAWITQQASKDDFLQRASIQSGEWLSTLPEDSPVRKTILKLFTQKINRNDIAQETRMRYAAALAITGDPQASYLFRHLLKSSRAETLAIAALGSGLFRDKSATTALINTIGHSPEVNRAACLALVQIGTNQALNAVAEALMTGDDQLRRAAAEALANHPEEGHPALQEGSTLEDDLLVRHAVVYGLKRIDEPWAVHMLEKMQIEEGEWMVRDAAQQAFQELSQPPAYIPEPLPPLEDIPWLIAFASEEGMGLAAGASSETMLIKALEKGDEEQKIAALSLIRRKGVSDVFPALYHALYGDIPEVNRAAFETIWHLESAGVNLPNPKQFGLG